MWLVIFMITATVNGESQVANSSTYLDAAITGFDPFYMTGIRQPNPGRRSKLFQPQQDLLYVPNKTVINSFIDEEQDINYLPGITVEKVVNFNQYLNFTTSSAYEMSADTGCSASVRHNERYYLCKTKNHHHDRAVLQFFQDIGGEVVFAKSDIVTHTITLSPLEIMPFTPAFQRAVEALYNAAVNPVPKIGQDTFNEFVRLYGTHFSQRTLLGSRVILGKLFSSRAATVEEETARRRCVLEAAREALTPCTRGCHETTRTVFTRASSERCGGEEHDAIVVVTGPLPERTLEDWASAAKNSPNPLHHELEPLSTIFNTDWFTEYYDRMHISINATILSEYFEHNLADYSRIMDSGGSNSFYVKGCGINSVCLHGTKCRNEPDMESGFSCVPEEDATTTTATTTATGTTTTITTTPTPLLTIRNITARRPLLTTTTTRTTTTIPTTTTSAPETTTNTTWKPMATSTKNNTTTIPTATTSEPTTSTSAKRRPTARTTSTSTTTTIPRTTTPVSIVTKATAMTPCSTFPGGGGQLNPVEGQPKTLTSHPGFGSSDYDNYMTFSRNLFAPYGYKVHVRMQNFSTEVHNDFLLIYDGYNLLFPQLAKLTGSPALTTYTSTTRDMLILFVTDPTTTSSGFSLTYEAVA